MGNLKSFCAKKLSASPADPNHTPTPSSAAMLSTTTSTSGPISITYVTPDSDTPITATYDFLVVACDPRFIPLTSLTPLESLTNDKLSSFTFRTALHRAKRPKEPQLSKKITGRSNQPNYIFRFNPEVLENLDGGVYAFRDEVMTRGEEQLPSPNGETWITTYQLDGRTLKGRDLDQAAIEYDEKRVAALNDPKVKWLDFVPDDIDKPQPEETLLVDYFPHFEEKDLQEGLPWQIYDAQGSNSTLYVSSFTCFESVLHCFLYGNRLMEDEKVLARFPKDKNARIAVIGAGPSGLLFASQHLARKGYNNFHIIEKEARFGGKTFTNHRPAPVGGWNVPCELGTCYLSLAYEPMFDLFAEYEAGEVVALDKDDENPFRSVIDPKVVETEEEQENGVEYGSWTLRKNGPWEFWEKIELYSAGVKYVLIHYAVMGMTINDCMPIESPNESTVLENLLRLLRVVLGKDDVNDDDDVPAKQAYDVLKNERKEEGGKFWGLFDKFGDMTIDEEVTKLISVKDLKKACRDVFQTTFAEFLDNNGMDELKSLFTYAYQVQGYGSIRSIPAYYGMVWVTPATLLGTIREFFDRSEGSPKRDAVNVLTKGWGTVWEKIVEKDLKEKLILNANITSIKRGDLK